MQRTDQFHVQEPLMLSASFKLGCLSGLWYSELGKTSKQCVSSCCSLKLCFISSGTCECPLVTYGWNQHVHHIHMMLMFRNVAYLFFYFLKKISEADTQFIISFSSRKLVTQFSRSHIHKGTGKRLRIITFLVTISV